MIRMLGPSSANSERLLIECEICVQCLSLVFVDDDEIPPDGRQAIA